jgi:hypothetical protein
MIRAAAPDTIAAAIEVPVRGTRAGEPPGAVDRILSPGAASATCGPRAETASGRPEAPSAATASTWR